MTSTSASQPSLRDEQLELTRARILDAVATLIAAEGVFYFTVQQVANRAGVSHRTIYRHFPDRTALLDALSARLDDMMAERLGTPIVDTDDSNPAESLGAAWRLFEQEQTLIEALVIASRGAGTALPGQRRRLQGLGKDLEVELTHLEEDVADAVMAVIRLLAGSTTWFAMRRDHDVDTDRARQAVQWAVRVLLADLRAGGGPGVEEADT